MTDSIIEDPVPPDYWDENWDAEHWNEARADDEWWDEEIYRLKMESEGRLDEYLEEQRRQIELAKIEAEADPIPFDRSE